MRPAKCEICPKRFRNKPCVNANLASNIKKKKKLTIKLVVVNEDARRRIFFFIIIFFFYFSVARTFASLQPAVLMISNRLIGPQILLWSETQYIFFPSSHETRANISHKRFYACARVCITNRTGEKIFRTLYVLEKKKSFENIT